MIHSSSGGGPRYSTGGSIEICRGAEVGCGVETEGVRQFGGSKVIDGVKRGRVSPGRFPL